MKTKLISVHNHSSIAVHFSLINLFDHDTSLNYLLHLGLNKTFFSDFYDILNNTKLIITSSLCLLRRWNRMLNQMINETCMNHILNIYTWTPHVWIMWKHMVTIKTKGLYHMGGRMTRVIHMTFIKTTSYSTYNPQACLLN